MSLSYNRVILSGRLTRDPELRTTNSGLSVVTITIAVDRYSRGEEKTADFISCVAWRDRADFIARYFAKGTPIFVEGTLQTRKYTDNTGKDRWVTEVQIDKVGFVESKQTESKQPESKPAEQPQIDPQQESLFDDPEDMLPF